MPDNKRNNSCRNRHENYTQPKIQNDARVIVNKKLNIKQKHQCSNNRHTKATH